LAGKANNKNLLFETIENWVFNKAKVAEIKTTYLDVHGKLDSANRQIYASPDVNIAYKDGEIEPNQVATCWRAFGDDVDNKKGELGFAIASPQLILREGKRIVDITIDLENNIGEINRKNFEAHITTPEGWFKLDDETELLFDELDTGGIQKGTFNIVGDGNKLTIRIALERDDPIFDSLAEEFKEDSNYIQSQWPIFKLTLPPTDESVSQLTLFEDFRNIKVSKVTIKVDVKGIKENLLIQSDQGVFDGTQKFFPFGSIPALGNRFYVGSTEVFQKALEDLIVTFNWIDSPSDFQGYYEEYKIVTGTKFALEPALEIDFIDKAEDKEVLVPLRFDKGFGINLFDEGENTIPSGTTIEGKITDIFNKGLDGLRIKAFNGNDEIVFSNQPVTKDEGFFSFSSPDLTPETRLVILHPDIYEPFAEDAIVLGFKNDNNELKGYYATLSLTLYPKRIEATNDLSDVSNKIVNVDFLTTPIPNITINDEQLSDAKVLFDKQKTNVNIQYINGEIEQAHTEDFSLPSFPNFEVKILPLSILHDFTGANSPNLDTLYFRLENPNSSIPFYEGITIKAYAKDNSFLDDFVLDKSEGYFLLAANNVTTVKIIYSNTDNRPLVVNISAENNVYRVQHYFPPAFRTIDLSNSIISFQESLTISLDEAKLFINGKEIQFSGTEILGNQNIITESEDSFFALFLEIENKFIKVAEATFNVIGNASLEIIPFPFEIGPTDKIDIENNDNSIVSLTIESSIPDVEITEVTGPTELTVDNSQY